MAEREDGLFFESGQGQAVQGEGMDTPIGEKEVEEAYTLLRKYQQGKANLESRVSNAEEWWKNNHWDRFSADSSNENGMKQYIQSAHGKSPKPGRRFTGCSGIKTKRTAWGTWISAW